MTKIDMQKLKLNTKLDLIADENYPFEEAIKLVNDSNEDMLLLSLKRQDANQCTCINIFIMKI